MTELPAIRWGIIATGMISSWFVEDLLISRSDAKVKHIVQAIGSSSVQKGQDFSRQYCPNSKPAIYGSYAEVYADPNVDIVYIGTPHAFHKQNCLDAIEAGKPILCEKAFTINTRETKEVFALAKAKGVYVAEAMWLRHRPLVQDLQRMLHKEKVIGDVFRVYSEFGLGLDIPNLPDSSRYKQPHLGAGSLLDLGIYTLTWAILGLDAGTPSSSEKPNILAAQSHDGAVEVTTSVILHYPSTGRQGVVTSTTMATGNPDVLARIQGTKGTIEVHGTVPSDPDSFTVYSTFERDQIKGIIGRDAVKTFDYKPVGRGYYWEADNAALDVLAGKLESDVMPWAETIRVIEMMDEIRRQGGTVYPQDKE
ncbi:dimeric dihydrodiol dehydrogenase [Colletotrichum godetiae]|uniref:D-xylose 1-dehydrogenase (NADP(+), D-xylono-1,5-lactone-forming) n=1 Tax=Colletotrichum godetiae TaxID=1209918 RepID=A0AAJ0ASG5_9PEZI|nr:dimeric dihydrodiol dehydrogenase [Colletotrichum godetiae]KAK1676966.1 dimeric dihydrodiol dehydrogenase [Colletotrichum godetiae]